VIENRVEDLISVVEILNPKELTPHWRFYSEFCETSRHKIRGFAKQSLSKLRSRLDRYIVNPDLSNLVLKIPEKIEHKIDLPWAFKKQKEAHDIPFESAKTMIARGESRPLTFAEQILLNGLLMKARLASNDYRLLDSEFIDPGEKIAAIKCLIQELCAAGRKVVVYSDWIKMLKLISRELDELKIGHTHFTGEMTPKKRNKSFEKFIYDQDVKVFLATDTGGVGIDGLQFVSDAVIHTEMVWNPAKYDQRNGRVVRNPNPSSKVDVYYISTQEGVEKMMQTSTSRKSALRQSFLGC
jgi:SNF2 family DNA or RNA helicase